MIPAPSPRASTPRHLAELRRRDEFPSVTERDYAIVSQLAFWNARRWLVAAPHPVYKHPSRLWSTAYPTLTAWRGGICDTSLVLLRRRTSLATQSRDWEKKQNEFAHKVEAFLYRKATTKEEYLDCDTLESRLQSLGHEKLRKHAEELQQANTELRESLAAAMARLAKATAAASSGGGDECMAEAEAPPVSNTELRERLVVAEECVPPRHSLTPERERVLPRDDWCIPKGVRGARRAKCL
jgi:hypothetical protein